MKKQIMSLTFILILCVAIFSISAVAVNPPESFMNEYIGIDSDRDEIYNGDDDWTIYHSYVDDICFVEYVLDLKNDGYEIVGNTPDYIENYIISNQKPSFDSEKQYTLKMAKQDYARILITYINGSGVKNSNDFEYTMSVKIMPGNEPTTLPQSTQDEQITQQSTTTFEKDANTIVSSNNSLYFVLVAILLVIILILASIIIVMKKKKLK